MTNQKLVVVYWSDFDVGCGNFWGIYHMQLVASETENEAIYTVLFENEVVSDEYNAEVDYSAEQNVKTFLEKVYNVRGLDKDLRIASIKSYAGFEISMVALTPNKFGVYPIDSLN